MSIGKWVNERTGISDVYRVVLARKIPKTGWAYTLGSATLFVMVNQIVTGILLSIYYVPTPDHAWGSVNYIQNEVLFGWLISRFASLRRERDGHLGGFAHDPRRGLWRLQVSARGHMDDWRRAA